MKERLQLALNAARVGEEDEARRILVELIDEDPDNVSAWILLSKLAQTDVQKAAFLRRVLALAPNNSYAREQFAALRAASEEEMTVAAQADIAAYAEETEAAELEEVAVRATEAELAEIEEATATNLEAGAEENLADADEVEGLAVVTPAMSEEEVAALSGEEVLEEAGEAEAVSPVPPPLPADEEAELEEAGEPVDVAPEEDEILPPMTGLPEAIDAATEEVLEPATAEAEFAEDTEPEAEALPGSVGAPEAESPEAEEAAVLSFSDELLDAEEQEEESSLPPWMTDDELLSEDIEEEAQEAPDVPDWLEETPESDWLGEEDEEAEIEEGVVWEAKEEAATPPEMSVEAARALARTPDLEKQGSGDSAQAAQAGSPWLLLFLAVATIVVFLVLFYVLVNSNLF